jgi:hypothetical protein
MMPERFPLAPENGSVEVEIREMPIGVGSRPSYRAVFTIKPLEVCDHLGFSDYSGFVWRSSSRVREPILRLRARILVPSNPIVANGKCLWSCDSVNTPEHLG